MKQAPKEVRIVLRLFSGLPDPEWVLRDDAMNDILSRLKALPLQPTAFQPSIIRGKPTDLLGRPRSGYRGFEVYADSESKAPLFHIYNNAVLDFELGQVRSDGTLKWEEEVWQMATPEVIKDLDNLTIAELRAPGNEQRIDGVQGPYVDLECASSPRFIGENDRFNDLSSENNCYNYATETLNRVERSRPAVPGRNNRRRRFNVPQLRAALAQDRLDLRGMTQPAVCPPAGAHWVAAMVRHQVGRLPDVHFLRLDRTGRWSHKDGNQPVDNTDDQGNLITDLTQAAFLGAPTLAGFYFSFDEFRNLIS